MPDKYEALRLRSQLCFPIYLCSKEITRRYAPMLEKINLTYTQYIVMMYFWENESASATEVCRSMMLDPSTLTPILKKLEQKGYLARCRNPRDERSLLVTLTEAGRALQDQALEIPAQMGRCLALTEDEARTLSGLIVKTLTNVEKDLAAR